MTVKESARLVFVLAIITTLSVINDKIVVADKVVNGESASREFALGRAEVFSAPTPPPPPKSSTTALLPAAAALNSARQDDYEDYFEDPDVDEDDSTAILNDAAAAAATTTTTVSGDGDARGNDGDIDSRAESRSEKLSWPPSNDNYDYGPAQGQTSLVVVFDGTSSMFDDLQQLKAGAKAIIQAVNQRTNNPIYNYVFVPFRDPIAGPKVVTRNQTVFLEAIDKLELSGGGDCPESALKGIEMGLESALPKSFVFVFTDAVANDFQFEPSVLQLIQEKQSSVTFLLTGFCDSKGQPGYNVYERIAEASNGQVFDLKKSDIGQVLSVMRDFLDSHIVPLKTVKNPKGENPPIALTVDNNIKMFSVSVSGMRPTITVKNSLQKGIYPNATLGVDTENLQIIKVVSPQSGTWSVSTRSDSENVVRVMGISELILEFGFSQIPLEVFNQSSFTPTLGVKNILSIRTQNAEQLSDLFMVLISFAPTQNLKDFALPLKFNETSKLFVTEPFEPPRSPFQLSVQGFDRDGIPIDRILSTEIKASIGSPPDVIFNEESQTVYVGSNWKISCQIRSFGVASSLILQNGKQILKMKFSDSDPQIFYDKVVDYSDSGEYLCSAKNEFGTRVKAMKLTIVDRPPQLQLLGKPIEGESVELRCSPLENERVQWKVDGVNIESVSPARFYEISGHSLILNHIQKSMTGNYSCIANSLDKLFVDVLYPVQEDPRHNKTIIFKDGDGLRVNCGLIGNPEPEIQWHNKDPFLINDRNEVDMIATSQINGIELTCSGVNEISNVPLIRQIRLQTNLSIVVSQNPDPVTGGENVTFDCNAPPKWATVRWTTVRWTINGSPPDRDRTQLIDGGLKLSLRNVVEGEELLVKCSVKIGFMVYHSAKKIHVHPARNEPPKIDLKSFEEYYLLDHQNDAVTLQCKATGLPIPQIYWTYQDKIITDGPKLVVSTLMDDGEYNCVAENSGGKDMKWTLVERKLPPVTAIEELVNLIEGETLNFTCPLARNQQSPGKEIIWTKDKIVLKGDQLLIVHASPSDAGKYSCCLPKSSYCASVTIVVQPKRKQMDKVIRYVELIPGEPSSIECLGDPSALRFKWTKNDHELDLSRSIILGGSINFEGQYKCLSSDDQNDYEVQYHVVYKQIPEINSVGLSGNSFKCEATGHPTPVLAWLHKGSKVASTTLVQYGSERLLDLLKDGQSLIISTDGEGYPMNKNHLWSPIDKSHGVLTQSNDQVTFDWISPDNFHNTTGVWTCVALNKWGSTNKTVIKEEIEPSPILLAGENERENHAVVQGLPLILECRSVISLENEISWMKNGKPTEQFRKIIIKDRNNSLIISETTSEDSGTYECLTRNRGGALRKIHHVNILEPPQLKTGSKEDPIYRVSVLKGKSTVLHCPINGTPEPTITWSQRHFTFDRSRSSTPITTQQRDLTINPQEPVEFYQCSANNSLGNSQVLFEITIDQRPIIKNAHSMTLTPKLYSSILMPCWTDGNPKPNITWYRNTRILAPSLRHRISANDQVVKISNIRSEDSGVYSCIAKNYLGTVSKTFSVLVSVPTILSPWSRWSNCSQSCGLGTRHRSRECLLWNGDPAPANNNPQCAGEKMETEECLITECAINGEWSEWTAWSACSASCKSSTVPEPSPAIRYRYRDCSNPAPSFGGSSCKGPSYQQEICDVPFCPIDGGWSEYSNWSPCTVSCGVGMRVRNRLCNSPVPQFAGRECEGELFEVQHCNEGSCSSPSSSPPSIMFAVKPPQHGTYVPPIVGWSDWSEWSECTAFCGSGVRSRTRKCLSAAGDCYGENIEFQQCDGDRCEVRLKEQSNQWYYRPEHGTTTTTIQASATLSSEETIENEEDDGEIENRPEKMSLYPTGNNLFQAPRVSITLESSIPLSNDISKFHFSATHPPTSSSPPPSTQNTSCELGYEFLNGYCEDINECSQEPSVCSASQICLNTRGGFTCECDSGYEMFEDAQKCVDVDECAMKLHDCSHTCVNSPGSYTCECPEGYLLADDFQTCVEEYGKLEMRDAPADDQVYFVDTDHCPDGYTFANGKCEDVDECVAWEENCITDQHCLNTRGSYVCLPKACPEHFVEQNDLPGTCYETCTNKTFHTCANDAQVANRITYVVAVLEKFDSERPVHKLIGYDVNRRPLVHTDFHLQYNPANNHIFHVKQWRQGVALIFARELQEERIYKLVAYGRTMDPETKELLYLHKFIIYFYR